MTDIAHVDAIYQALIYENFEPIISAIERGETWVIEQEPARLLIAKHMRRAAKKANRPKKEDTKTKMHQRAALAWYYHGMGYPKWNNPERADGSPSPMSACRKASLELPVGESAVKTAMKKYKNTTLAAIAYEKGSIEKNQGN